MSSSREETRGHPKFARSPRRAGGRSCRPAGANKLLIAAALLAIGATGIAKAQAQVAANYSGIGRAATPQELAAWDIDVRPDFKGLPPGSGSVAQGQLVWEAKCAHCHGVFGESNQTFSPLVGGTTADDVRTGHVARLNDPSFPGRTTLMKVPTLSTLWDYINRAMPWTAPKSLKPDEVYAVTAFLLNLGGIVPDNTVLSDRTMAEVQQRLPNRNGLTTDHGLWPDRAAANGGIGNGGRPDVKAAACMHDCPAETRVRSSLPDFARNAHGNLAEQNRSVGAQRGADTRLPPRASLAEAKVATPTPTPTPAAAAASAHGAAAPGNAAALALAQKHTCTACHGVDNKIVGPSFHEVAKKYGERADAVAYLAGKIRSGGAGLWGAIPMPPQDLPDTDAQTLAAWLAAGARR